MVLPFEVDGIRYGADSMRTIVQPMIALKPVWLPSDGAGCMCVDAASWPIPFASEDLDMEGVDD